MIRGALHTAERRFADLVTQPAAQGCPNANRNFVSSLRGVREHVLVMRKGATTPSVSISLTPRNIHTNRHNVKVVLVRGPKIKERKCPGKIQI